MLSEEILKQLLKEALKKGGNFAEVFVERRISTTLRLEDRKVEIFTTGLDLGAGIRVISGSSTVYVFIDSLNPTKLLEAGRIAASALQLKSPRRTIDLTTFSELKPLVSHPFEILPDCVKRAKKVEFALRADEKARSYSREIRQVSVSYTDTIQDIQVANSEGIIVKDRRVYTRFFVHVIARRGDRLETGYEAPGLLSGLEFYNQHSPEEIAEIAARRAIIMLGAKEAPVGEMPVVLAKGSGGVLFHEACGHGLEADAIRKGASIYVDKKGEKIASEKVSAADDPTLINQWGSFSFDDEGNPARQNLLIEKGILRSFMYDRFNARQIKISPTSNGRRQSFRHAPLPRMTNTFILPGKDKEEEILGSVKRGLYAKALGGGEVNTTTGDFVFAVTEGYLIEKGELTYPVRGALLIGNGPRVLTLIDMVGTELGFEAGMCGKAGQAVPVATGQPMLKIRKLTVGGTKK